MGRALVWFAILCPMWAATTHADPLVVHDRVDRHTRELTLVVPNGDRCLPARDISIGTPFVVTTRGRCTISIAGPDAAPIVLTWANTLHVVDPDLEPPIVVERGGPPLEIRPHRSVRVGATASAAYLIVRRNGLPTSDIELRVTVEGATPRALRWIAAGLAEVDVTVATWRPTIELAVHRDGTTTTALVPVDPGPPLDVELHAPPVIADQAAPLVATVKTVVGVPIAPERVRVITDRCVATDAGVRCKSGPVVARIELRLESGVWAPIDERTFEVRLPEPPPMATEKTHTIGIDLALRAGTSLDAWSTGLSIVGRRTLDPRIAVAASAGWRYARDSLSHEMPVTRDVTLAHHELAVSAGVVWTPWPASAFMRGTGGVSIVRTSLDGVGAADLGMRGHLEVAAGAMFRRLSSAVGFRAIRDFVVAGWRDQGLELFVEVSYAVLR